MVTLRKQRNLKARKTTLDHIVVSNINNFLLIGISVLLLALTLEGSLVSIPNTGIKQVTISGQEAEIQKEFKVTDLEHGYHTLIVRDLPESIDEKTIRIKGKGYVELLSTMIENVVINREQDDNYNLIYNNLQSVVNELSRVHQLNNFELERVKLRVHTVQLYTSMTINSSQISETNALSLDKINEYITYQDEVMKKSITEMHSIQTKIYTVQSLQKLFINCVERLQKIGKYIPVNSQSSLIELHDENLDKLYSKLPSNELLFLETMVKKNLHIRIFIPEDVANGSSNKYIHTFELTYGASPAQWNPQYDIKVENKNDETGKYLVAIDFYAAVEQRTGENWPDVKLILSSTIPKHNFHRLDWRKKIVKFQDDMAATSHAYDHNGAARSRMKRSKSMHLAVEEEAFMDGAVGSVSMRAAPPPPDMVVQAASVEALGDLGSAYHFTCTRAVNISTNPKVYTVSPERHRLFVDSIQTPTTVFTYVVPTQSSTAYLQAWGTLNNLKTNSGHVPVPLLHSSSVRVFLQGAYTGTTYLPATQPGGELRLDLGEDQNIKVTHQYIPPTHRSGEEDKSTWFTTDKKKFRFKMEEHSFTIKSTHTKPHLVLVTEHIPRSTEEDIKAELLTPTDKDVVNIPENQGNEQDLLNYVLKENELMKSDKKTKVFYSDSNRFIIWSVIVNPGETINLSLKYRLSWPDGKQITVESY